MIIELSKRLESINFDREKEIIKKQIEALEKQIDNIFYKLYGITKAEQEIIEKS